MGLLDGFVMCGKQHNPHYFITLMPGCILVSRSVILELGEPDWIRAYVKENTKQLALTKGEAGDCKAKSYLEKKCSVKITKGCVLSAVKKISGYKSDGEAFRIPGTLAEEGILIFDLSTHEPVRKREKKSV